MKKSAKASVITLSLIVDLCIVCMIWPTLGQQVPFNEWVWKHHPVHKTRYYMSDSLVEKLNRERPTREETTSMLGPEPDGFIQGENHLSYWLYSPGLIGLKMYSLEIDFTNDGTFMGADVVYSD